MSFSLRQLSKVQLISLCLVGFTGIAVTAMSGRKLVSRMISSPKEAREAVYNVASLSQQKKTIEVVVVTLTPGGFFPKEVTIPKKRFVLAINNRTGQPSEASFSLFREKTDKLREVKLKQETMSLQLDLDLPPGNYELREQNNPKWVLTLTGAKQ